MISVLLATYNGAEFLGEQIDSILNQTLTEIKIFIHDDGSSDNTREIIDQYIAKYPKEIEYVDGPATGSSRNNFFFLLEQVDSEYYMFCDQDDYWLPNKVEELFRKITSVKIDGDIPQLVFSDLKVVDERLNVIDESFMHYNRLCPDKHSFNYLLAQNCAPGCTMLFNRKTRDESIKFKETSNPAAIPIHDWWVILVAEALGTVQYVDKSLMLYRQHSNNAVGAVKDYGTSLFFKEIWWLVSMSKIQSTKNRIAEFVNQGMQLSVLSLDGETKEIVDGLCSFYEWNKIKRLRFVLSHKIFRSKRNLWQLICL